MGHRNWSLLVKICGVRSWVKAFLVKLLDSFILLDYLLFYSISAYLIFVLLRVDSLSSLVGLFWVRTGWGDSRQSENFVYGVYWTGNGYGFGLGARLGRPWVFPFWGGRRLSTLLNETRL